MLLLLLMGIVQVGAQVIGPSPSDVCTEGSCYPATGDLLIGRAHQLSATSTCGLKHPEPFCIVSHLQDEKKCFQCVSMASYDYDVDDVIMQTDGHRIENVVTTFHNRLKTWWQSENGLEYVTIQLDLEAEFHFTHLIMTFKTFRPAAMVIERSADYGRTYQVYRYFAYDCAAAFPAVPRGAVQRVDDVICDSRYSDIEPSTEGEVIFRVLDPVFHIDDPYSPRIQNMLKITNLRVRFTKLHTLGDNLLDPREEIKEKYYYAVYDMVVRGNCFCYGHASECAPVAGGGGVKEGMVHGHCMCNHNTKGLNCELCDDFHHVLPWKPAEGKNTNACKRCDCNLHSSSCHFDRAAFTASGNVSGAVCDNCEHHTAGHSCEICLPFYYQHPERDPRDPNVCIACDCDPTGSVNGGLCDGRSDSTLGLISGQCRCKQNVEGERCEKCKEGHYGLSEEKEGCTACTCNPIGTVPGGNPCDSESGNCFCKRLVTGRDCDKCMEEHWGLSNDVDGCRPCDCDVGGALNNQCDQTSGQCVCMDHMFGRRCDQVQSGFYFMSLDHYTFEAEEAHTGPGTSIVPRPLPLDRSPTWTGSGLVLVPEGSFLEFSILNLPQSMEYDIIVRYEPQLPDQWEEVLLTVVRPGPITADSRCINTVPNDDHQTISLHPGSRHAVFPRPVCLEKGLNYTARLTLPLYSALSPIHSPFTLIDSIVLMPHCQSLDLFSTDPGSAANWDTFTRYRCLESSRSVVKSPSTEICDGFIFSISAMLHQGATECVCDAQGSLSSVCEPMGGQCECRQNVIGRSCDRCSPGTFQFGPNGCRACECDAAGSVSQMCAALSGQCVCVAGASGRTCGACLHGYYGFPACRACACNAHAESCDPQTGKCLECREHTTGHSCDRCMDGYYGNPTLGSGETCRPCLCPDGPISSRQFASSCYRGDDSPNAVCVCNPGYRGARCDQCSPGYHGNPSSPGGQCSVCECNGNIDQSDPRSCDAATGLCLQCLFNSDGAHCERCRDGFYGNATQQDCRECECDPLGSVCAPGEGEVEGEVEGCVCNHGDGQCTCRPRVIGRRCDRCEPKTWNRLSGSGCEHCACDPIHSYGEQCDEVSGQCKCHPGFGGRTCSECRERFWGNPEEECHACDCEPIGSLHSQCDKSSGQCVCVGGVSGPRCSVCGRGFSGTFPDCQPCHQCFSEWDEVIGRLTNHTHRLVNKIHAIKANGGVGEGEEVGGESESREPIRRLQRAIQEVTVMVTANPNAQPLSEIQGLVLQASDLMAALSKTLNQSEARISQTAESDAVAGNKMAAVHSEAFKLEETVSELLEQLERVKNSDITGATASVTKYFLLSQQAEANANASTLEPGSAVASSASLRQQTEDKVNETREGFGEREKERAERLDELAGQLQGLDLYDVIKPCGSDVSDGCVSVATAAENSLDQSQSSEQDISRALREVDLLSTMVKEAKEKADDAKLHANAVLSKANRTKSRLDQSNQELRALIGHIRDFLTQDSADLASIELVANEVLALRMPADPDHMQNLTESIRQKVDELVTVETILEQSAQEIARAESLLKQAAQASEEAAGVRDQSEAVMSALKEARKAQSAASSLVQQAKQDINSTNRLIRTVQSESADAESKMADASERLQRLEQEVGHLKEQSHDLTQSAQLTNHSAARITAIAMEVNEELDSNVKPQYSDVEQLIGQKAGGVARARKRAELLQQEAKQLLLKASDKLTLLKDLEQSYSTNQKTLEEKAELLTELESAVRVLLREIGSKVTLYSTCLS